MHVKLFHLLFESDFQLTVWHSEDLLDSHVYNKGNLFTNPSQKNEFWKMILD